MLNSSFLIAEILIELTSVEQPHDPVRILRPPLVIALIAPKYSEPYALVFGTGQAGWNRNQGAGSCLQVAHKADSGRAAFGPKPLHERGLPSTPALNLLRGFATIYSNKRVPTRSVCSTEEADMRTRD